MGFCRSDVVLNSQARTSARRCGAEARMTEGEGRGSIESGHEGLDPRPVLLLDVVNVSAIDCFDGNTRSKLVEGLMGCLLYTSPSPRDGLLSRMPSSA